MNRRIFILAVSLCLLAGVARAQTGETPAALDKVTTVTAEVAKDLIAKGAKVFDMRKKAAFAEGHIPGAVSGVSAFNKDTNAVDAAIFGPNKDLAIVIHGHGTDGWTAVHAAKAAVAAGFSKVHWLRGGWAEWSGKGFPSQQ
jgi:rhodanese-related sulfurtransferase